jgi:transcriptional regulator with XRE-family HTH domain
MRRLREEAGLRSDELAARLGREPSWVSQRECGAVRLSAGEVPVIEEALGVPAGTLLGGDALTARESAVER